MVSQWPRLSWCAIWRSSLTHVSWLRHRCSHDKEGLCRNLSWTLILPFPGLGDIVHDYDYVLVTCHMDYFTVLEDYLEAVTLIVTGTPQYATTPWTALAPNSLLGGIQSLGYRAKLVKAESQVISETISIFFAHRTRYLGSIKWRYLVGARKHVFSVASPDLWNTIAPEIYLTSTQKAFHKSWKTWIFPPTWNLGIQWAHQCVAEQREGGGGLVLTNLETRSWEWLFKIFGSHRIFCIFQIFYVVLCTSFLPYSIYNYLHVQF